MANEDFKAAAAADQEKTISDIYSGVKPDYVGEDIALSQAEYAKQVQQEKEYAESQRALQLRQNEITGEIEAINSSEKITAAQNQLAKLKQTVAYLGSQ